MIPVDQGKTQLVEINIQIKPFPHKNDIIMIALLTWLILINNIYYYILCSRLVWWLMVIEDIYANMSSYWTQ